MRFFIAVLLVFAVFPLAAVDLHVWFWNMDAEELALGGSMGAREGGSPVLAGNPAGVPVSSSGGQGERFISFPNAFRMAFLLVRETGALPYDAVAADERADESKSHGKWMGLSLLSLYRFRYQLPGVSISFLPMREYPARGDVTLFSSTAGINFDVLGLVGIGFSGTWYYSVGIPAWNPFELSELDTVEKSGFGAAAGILLKLGRVRVGLDYRFLPGSIFKGLDLRGLPVRDNSLALAFYWKTTDTLDISLDLPNWNNTGRDDFLLPRAGVMWRFHRLREGYAAIQGGFFFDGLGDPYLTSGASLRVRWGSFIFTGGATAIFDLANGKANALVFSADFFM